MDHPIGANEMAGGTAGPKLCDAHRIPLPQPITLDMGRTGKNPTFGRVSIPYHCRAGHPAYKTAMRLDTEEP
jgi:hypothetical protein